jgi:hypothetical protein
VLLFYACRHARPPMLCCLSPRLTKASAADCIDPDQETHLDVWTTLNSPKSGCNCIKKRVATRPVYKSHEDSSGSDRWRPFDHQRKQMGKTPTPFRQLVLAKNSRRSPNDASRVEPVTQLTFSRPERCTHFQNQRASKRSKAACRSVSMATGRNRYCARPFLVVSRSSRVLDGDESRRRARSAAHP